MGIAWSRFSPARPFFKAPRPSLTLVSSLSQPLMRSEPLTVLGAGPGLGFYVPAAILARQVSRSRPVDLVPIESLLPAEKQAVVERSRLAFHRSFDVARMGQRLAKDITGDLDAGAVEALLEQWRREERRDFAVFSG